MTPLYAVYSSTLLGKAWALFLGKNCPERTILINPTHHLESKNLFKFTLDKLSTSHVPLEIIPSSLLTPAHLKHLEWLFLMESTVSSFQPKLPSSTWIANNKTFNLQWEVKEKNDTTLLVQTNEVIFKEAHTPVASKLIKLLTSLGVKVSFPKKKQKKWQPWTEILEA